MRKNMSESLRGVGTSEVEVSDPASLDAPAPDQDARAESTEGVGSSAAPVSSIDAAAAKLLAAGLAGLKFSLRGVKGLRALLTASPLRVVVKRASRVTRGAVVCAAEVALLGPVGPFMTRSARVVMAGARGAVCAPRGASPLARVERAVAAAWGRTGPGLRVCYGSVLYAVCVSGRRRSARAYRCMAVQAGRCYTAEDVRALSHAHSWLPDAAWVPNDLWWTPRDLQQVEWINTILQSIQSYLSKASATAIRNLLEPLLEEIKPKGVSSMKFKEFSLGPEPVQVESVRLVASAAHNQIQLQLAVKWEGRPNILFELYSSAFYGGLTPIAVEVTNVVFRGTMQVSLNHLFGGAPLVGGLQLMFVEEPHISYDIGIKAMPGAPLMNINLIPGLQAGLVYLVNKAIRDNIMFPNPVMVVLARAQPKEVVAHIEDSLKVSPIGTLAVRVIAARQLRNSDMFSKSDPYVTLGVGSRRLGCSKDTEVRSRVIKDNLNPVWDEVFELTVCSLSLQYLWVQVYDDDGQLNADDLLGCVLLPLAALEPNRPSAGWHPLRGDMADLHIKKRLGEIHLQVEFRPNPEAGPSEHANKTERTSSERVKSKEVARPWKSKWVHAFDLAKTCHQLETLENAAKVAAEAAKAAGPKPLLPAFLAPPSDFTLQVGQLLGASEGRVQGYLADAYNGRREALRFDAATYRRLASCLPEQMEVGGIPIWATHPTWQRCKWLNEILLTLWPYASSLIAQEIRILNEHVLSSLLPAFMVLKVNVDIGEIPPVIEALRVFELGSGGSNDEGFMLEVSLKVAGDQLCEGVLQLRPNPLQRFAFQVAELQFMAVLRLQVRPIIPKFPLITGVSVSFIGTPFMDMCLRLQLSPLLPALDLMNLPGVGLLKRLLLGPLLRRLGRYPSALHIPLMDFDQPALQHLMQLNKQNKGQDGHNVLTVRILQARNLPASDLGGASDPFVSLTLAGEAPHEDRTRVTATRAATLTPRWDEQVAWAGFPAHRVELFIAVYDEHRLALVDRSVLSREEVAAALEPMGDLQARSLETAKMYMIDVMDIPWHPVVKDWVIDRFWMKVPLVQRVFSARQKAIEEYAGPLPPPEEAAVEQEAPAESLPEIKTQVVSDVEQVTRAQLKEGSTLLGATLLDVEQLVQPGATVTTWVPLSGSLLGEARRADPSRPAELQLQLRWSVQRQVSAGARGCGRGTVTVELSQCVNLAKPSSKVGLGKFSTGSLCPQVDVVINTQAYRTVRGRGLNPEFDETFDFLDVDPAAHLLSLRVFHSSMMGKVHMGRVTIPLGHLARHGFLKQMYPLEGVRSGQVAVQMTYREDVAPEEDAGGGSEERGGPAPATGPTSSLHPHSD